MGVIRRVQEDDCDALYEVCLLTGDSGMDASGLHADPKMLGDVYVGPYLKFASPTSFALIDESNLPVGYGLSVLDTESFEELCRGEWWPKIQEKYSRFQEEERECWLIHEIFNPTPSPTRLLDRYPSHGHIDLLPSMQGKGFGRKMMTSMETALTKLGSAGFHLRVSSQNLRALKFYAALGYAVIDDSPDVITVGKRLG